MRRLREGAASRARMYPVRPRLILLEQPEHLGKDDWAADDPCSARESFSRMIGYSREEGVPVFSTHPAIYRGTDENGIIPVDIHASGTGFVLSDCHGSPFLDSVIFPSGGPVIVGGAHARIERGAGPLRLLRPFERLLTGICLVRPLSFLQAMKESGLLDCEILLDPRITIQLGSSRLEPSWLYGVSGRAGDGFRLRPSFRLDY